jgi:hypothetical protein
METVLAFVLGLLLRIGIPVGVTILVISLLRRLDKRWQADALSVPLAAPKKPCWKFKGCTEEKRKNCPAAAQPKVPCWQVFRAEDGVMKEDCLGCEVFRQAPVPVRI